MMLTRRCALGGLAGALLAVGPARAHRLHLALTTVEWRAHRNALEVVHRLYDHDLAAALGEPRHGADFENVRTRAEAALYVAEQFLLVDAEGEELQLALIGAEHEGEYVFVYQEASFDAPPPIGGVFAGALLDVLDGQVNTVNLNLGDGVRTLEFRTGDGVKQLHR